MKKVTQTFTKGVNRRIPRDQSASDRLHTLQNARIYKRGESLHVSRIEGYRDWPLLENTDSIAATTVLGQWETDNAQRGYRLEFSDGVGINDVVFDRLRGEFADAMFTEEQFKVFVRPKLIFIEGVQVGVLIQRAPRKQPRLIFVEGVNIDDNETNNTFGSLSFTDGIEVRDTPLCG